MQPLPDRAAAARFLTDIGQQAAVTSPEQRRIRCGFCFSVFAAAVYVLQPQQEDMIVKNDENFSNRQIFHAFYHLYHLAYGYDGNAIKHMRI